MGENFRIGNDIVISWTLLDAEGNPYGLSDRNIRIILEAENTVPLFSIAISDITVDRNVLSFIFYGKDQKISGTYRMKLIENRGNINMITFDVRNVFVLVDHSWQTSATGPLIPPIPVDITSTIDVGYVGPVGPAAGFGEVTANLVSDGGEPSASVETSGPDTAKNFDFTFYNLEAFVTEENIESALGYKPVAPDQVCWEKGSGENSVQQKGTGAIASGESSHAEGTNTSALNASEHAQGKYNVSHHGSASSEQTIHSVGVGTGENDRKNAFEIMQNGDAYLFGIGGYDGTNPANAKTLQKFIGGLEEITYATLVSKRNNSQLVPGRWYRITDYTTTTTQENTRSAGNQFDVIVLATDVNKLSEEARAIVHAGDTYFTNAGADLEGWKIWYCLDNDINRFLWADGTNGKGVIYRMIDEWGNDCPYDFKNIQFVKPNSFIVKWSSYVYHTYVENSNVVIIGNITYRGYTRITPQQGPPPPPTHLYIATRLPALDSTLYTINNGVASVYSSATIFSVDDSGYVHFTFSGAYNEILQELSVTTPGTAHNNIIKPYVYKKVQKLNNIVLVGLYTGSFSYNNINNNIFGGDCYNIIAKSGPYHNRFGCGCHDNTFVGDECHDNVFGNKCYDNTFGNRCNTNTFGNNCFQNSIGNNCEGNVFGDFCAHNRIGNSCNNNVFGIHFSNSSIGSYFEGNKFGPNCSDITFGDYCQYNVFGNSCRDFFFGADSAKNYCRYLTVESGNQRIRIYVPITLSSTNYYQNVKIAQGVNNTNTWKSITDTNTNQTYQTTYQPANSQVINI